MDNPEYLTSGSDHSRNAAIPSPSRALLLCGEKLSFCEQNLTKLLDFFGIPWRSVSPGELIREHASSGSDSKNTYCILSSAPQMAAALQDTMARAEPALPAWILAANSVYLYGFQETPLCRKLLGLLTGAIDGDMRKPTELDGGVSVTREFPEMCGPLSGLRMRVELSESDFFFDLDQRAAGRQTIITSSRGEMFVSVMHSGTRFFLNASPEIIDINSPAASHFDVKEHFCSTVPAVMFLKWAFADICWTGAETRGCLIIDDPLLKPRYGFLRFQETLELMDEHNFATTIAFIPWNWRRTDQHTVRQFQSRSDRLSLCVHGCDHTGGEFAARSTAFLNKRIKIANQRMELLAQRTSLRPDNIMVFPQGLFSPESGRALKLNGFDAAVNSEVAPSGGAPNDTKIADLWNVAIMKYGTFPIYTRRYLTQGIENFAFDALLGKPCLMVAHHEIFKDRGQKLVEFIDRLNSLQWDLRWCPLGDAIDRSYRIRGLVQGNCTIQMYAEHLVIENDWTGPSEIAVIREETDPDCVKAILVNQKPVDWVHEGGHLQFKAGVAAGERTEIRIMYLDKLGRDLHSDGIAYGLKIGVRRHLSEFRDNYVSQNDFLNATAAKVRSLLN